MSLKIEYRPYVPLNGGNKVNKIDDRKAYEKYVGTKEPPKPSNPSN